MKEVSPEVFYCEDPVVFLGDRELQFLKEKVGGTPRKRARLCAHRDALDPVHEMFVALTRESYVRPHKHLNKSESFHIIEGSMDLVVFDDAGRITEVAHLSDDHSGGRFYFRFASPSFHTLVIRSEQILFHETTSGPFKKEETVFASWAPEEQNREAGKEFMEQLARTVQVKD